MTKSSTIPTLKDVNNTSILASKKSWSNKRDCFTPNKAFWPKSLEEEIAQRLIGFSLNAGVGQSRLGDVRLDLNGGTTRNIRGSYFELPFKDKCFDSVISDGYYSSSLGENYAMLREIMRVCRHRIIFENHYAPVGYFLNRGWELSEWGVVCGVAFFSRVRFIGVFDKTVDGFKSRDRENKEDVKEG